LDKSAIISVPFGFEPFEFAASPRPYVLLA
jgi:hypothetical protein